MYDTHSVECRRDDESSDDEEDDDSEKNRMGNPKLSLLCSEPILCRVMAALIPLDRSDLRATSEYIIISLICYSLFLRFATKCCFSFCQ